MKTRLAELSNKDVLFHGAPHRYPPVFGIIREVAMTIVRTLWITIVTFMKIINTMTLIMALTLFVMAFCPIMVCMLIT